MNSPISFQVEAPIPAKKNSRIVLKDGRNIPSEAYRRWHGANIRRLRDLQRRHGTFTCPVSVSVGIAFGDRRRRDGDNQLSSVQDLLVKAGVIEDDCWTRIGTPRVSHAFGKEARCEIRVFEVVPIDWKEKILETKKKSVRADVSKFRLDKKHIEDLSVLETYQNPVVPA